MSLLTAQRGSLDAESEMLPQQPPPWIVRSTGWVLIGAFLFALLVAIVLGIPGGFLLAHAIRVPLVKSLENYQPAIITRIYDRNGIGFAEYSIQKRIVSLSATHSEGDAPSA